MKKNGKSFIFILGISILTLVLLVVFSFVFRKDSSLAFIQDGYIITSNSERYYFKSGTTYKENLEHKYAFSDDNKKDVTVDMASFIHYNDKSIGFMQNGAIMDLMSANKSIVPYYNITNKSTISYKDGNYVINTATKSLGFEDILGRISDNKYIVAGKNLTLKLPEVEAGREGDYFEITFVEEGVVKIENQEVNYQTTTQGTYIYAGDKVSIDFGGMKVVYDGDASMSLSQITINGEENIDVIDDEDKAVKPGDSKKDDNNSNDNKNNQVTNNELNNNTNDGLNNDSKDNKDNKDNNEKENSTDKYVELLDASVTTNMIKASFKYNNTKDLKGNLLLTITDIGTGSKAYSKVLDKTKSLDDIIVESLSPNTNYLMTIYSSNGDITNQYFQQSFRTEELGIVLNKVYATSSSLSYNIIYQDNSNVKAVTLALYNEKAEKVGESVTSTIDNNEEIRFNNLDSNTSYTVKVEDILLNSLNYVNVYNIQRTDITLKKNPDAASMELTTKTSKSGANLNVSKVSDPDSSIKSYTYKIYAGSYSGDQENRILYSKTVAVAKDTTSSSMKFDLADLDSEDRKLGYYRFSVDIAYYDNEKTMVLTNQKISSAFYLTEDSQDTLEDGKVRIDFEQDFDNTTYSSIAGKIKITDTKHKILVSGRDGYDNADTKFTIRYYSGDISTMSSTSISINSSDIDSDGYITKDIIIDGLTNNSGYIIELYADMYDEEGNVVNQIIDRSFSATTKSDVDKLKFTFSKDNGSDDNNVINFDGLISLTNPESKDTLKSVKVKLYKGSSAEIGNLIGEELTINGEDIFNKNYNFTNNSFGITDVLDLTEKSGGTLYQNYTIEITDAYYNSGNKAEVENNIYTYTISLAYMIERQLEKPTIAVSPITNGSTYTELDESTIIGYEVTAGAAIEKLKEMLGNLGIESINYYIYKLDSDGNEVLIKTIQSDALSTSLYFNGINEYDRGGKYIFKYDISIAGLSDKYPTKPVASSVYTPEKQSPLYSIYKSYSTDNSIVYKYKFTDIDNAIHKESDDTYKFYFKKNDSEEYEKYELTIDKDDDNSYHELTFDNMIIGDSYSINYKKETVSGSPVMTEIESDVFEGEQNIDNYDVKYKLQYSENDNRLAIKLLDNDFLKRIILYEVTIKDTSGKVDDYVKLFSNDDITVGPSGDSNCLVIDYATIEKFIGKDTKVSVKAYYDNGLTGLDIKSKYGYVFENREGGHLYLDSKGNIKTGNSISLYNFSYKDNTMSISDYFNKDISKDVEINYVNNGVNYGDLGSFDPKGISYGTINTDDDNFRFDSIIPKVKPVINEKVDRSINSFKINIEFSGLTVDSLKNQFKVEDNKYYVYVDLYKDIECTDQIKEQKIEIALDSSKEIGYKITATEFTLLMPDTEYYYKLYAYLKQSDGNYKKIELFDANGVDGYTHSIYNISTMGSDEIFSTISAYYNKTHFNGCYYGDTSKINCKNSNGTIRIMDLQYRKKSGVNYKLKMQLLDENGNDYFKETALNRTDSLKGEEKIVDVSTNASGFDAFSMLLDDNFVFGDGYYRLVLTAVSDTPITLEDGSSDFASLELYNEALVSTDNQYSSNPSRVNVAELKDPTFDIVPTSELKDGKPVIKLTITPKDDDKVIVNSTGEINKPRGYYVVTLVDANGKKIVTTDSYQINGKAQSVTFDGNTYSEILANSYYYVRISTYTYKNNKSLVGTSQPVAFNVSKIVYTPSTGGISLGNVSTSINSSSITLTHTGASGMNDIDKITYSIAVDGGSKLVNSKDIVKTNNQAIFNVDAKNNYKLNFTGLKLSSGNIYLVQIAYYQKNSSGGYDQLFGGNIAYTVVYED